MNSRKMFLKGLLCAAVLCLPGLAAETYTFDNITNNNPTDAAIGEAQLFVDVSDAGGGLVLFTFRNTGPLPSSIADVYFDDGPLSGISGLIDADDGVGGDAGVDFSTGATPSNLPGGNSIFPVFTATAGLTADSDPPVQPNGVNPGEQLGMLLTLAASNDFNDVIADLGDGDLRIGIHVQGFASGGSESFINNPGNGNGIEVIPSPSAVVLGGIGVLAVGLLKKF